MTKRLLIYSVVLSGVFVASYFLHVLFLENNNHELPFNLLGMYWFNAAASLLVYLFIEVIASKLPSQAGYSYLVSVFLKLGFFLLIFKNEIFSAQELQMVERLSIVLPLLLFLTLETVFSARLLNSQ